MNEIINNTQINDNECGKIKYELIDDKYTLKTYSGKVIEMTLADFQALQKCKNEYDELFQDFNNIKDELNRYKKEMKNAQKKMTEYVERVNQREANWKNALDAANRKLVAFTNNQKGGKVKFTPEMQRCVLQVISKGGSITMAHNAIMKEFNSPDISYETIRRYVAEIRLKNR